MPFIPKALVARFWNLKFEMGIFFANFWCWNWVRTIYFEFWPLLGHCEQCQRCFFWALRQNAVYTQSHPPLPDLKKKREGILSSYTGNTVKILLLVNLVERGLGEKLWGWEKQGAAVPGGRRRLEGGRGNLFLPHTWTCTAPSSLQYSQATF